MGKAKDLSEFDKDQIVMARRLGQSISSSFGVFPVCNGQYLSKVLQGRNSGEPVTGSWAAKTQRRLARVVRSNRRAPVAQITPEVNAGSDRKVSEYTVHQFVAYGAADQSGCPC
ncbi:hypothetical protein DPX16_2477 [Anabarilius grahami]|uniref:Uncharacterized protein n=1 Tax=Anabarilius grahami TaxID=495550 RepID=A0A3N0Z6K4_ANAGA|nr:hypothetical protein DPX16_2477 [Anabarilius grahami]